MKKLFFIAAAIVALASCEALKEEFTPVFTTEYENPARYKYYTDSDFSRIITIAEVASRYQAYVQEHPSARPWTVNEDLTVAGIVTTTDQPGNFYKSFYIQDETGGMEIKIGKNGLYNDYLPGQKVYVKLTDLTVGMYGYKTGTYGGQGMVQVGFSDPSGEYETSYLETPFLINYHVFRGNPKALDPVEPQVITESQLPNGKSDTQATNKYIGSLVTLKGLKYANEAFALLYLDSNKNKKASENRIFLSDKTWGITTWAMSENKMKDYLLSGIWDSCLIGNSGDQKYGTVGDKKGDGTYPGIEKAAASVSQYFTMGSTEIQLRSSGYSKFADSEIPAEVLSGQKTVNLTGILTIYQGSLQFVVNSLDDIEVNN